MDGFLFFWMGVDGDRAHGFDMIYGEMNVLGFWCYRRTF